MMGGGGGIKGFLMQHLISDAEMKEMWHVSWQDIAQSAFSSLGTDQFMNKYFSFLTTLFTQLEALVFKSGCFK